jgi:hypothetical protein
MHHQGHWPMPPLPPLATASPRGSHWWRRLRGGCEGRRPLSVQVARRPWGNAGLAALCRHDRSGGGLRLAAELALDVLRESDTPDHDVGATAEPAPAVHTADVSDEASSEVPEAPGCGWGPARVRRWAVGLRAGLVGREREASLLLLAGLAGEHMLLVGPPGTGKSVLARQLGRALGVGTAGGFFERQLSRFTTPEELLGPLSLAVRRAGPFTRGFDGLDRSARMAHPLDAWRPVLPRAPPQHPLCCAAVTPGLGQALAADEHRRCSVGYLPDPAVRLAFLDELLRASPALLNLLLALLAEPAGPGPPPRPCVLAAVPGFERASLGEELAPLLDRFLCPGQPGLFRRP